MKHGRERAATAANSSEVASVTIDATIGQLLRRIRNARGLSQAQVARRVNLSFQQIQKYETGYSRVTVAKLCELAEALNVPVTAFFTAIRTDGGTPDVPMFSDDAWRVASHYDTIKSPQMRKQVLELVKCLAEE